MKITLRGCRLTTNIVIEVDQESHNIHIAIMYKSELYIWSGLQDESENEVYNKSSYLVIN